MDLAEFGLHSPGLTQERIKQKDYKLTPQERLGQKTGDALPDCLPLARNLASKKPRGRPVKPTANTAI